MKLLNGVSLNHYIYLQSCATESMNDASSALSQLRMLKQAVVRNDPASFNIYRLWLLDVLTTELDRIHREFSVHTVHFRNQRRAMMKKFTAPRAHCKDIEIEYENCRMHRRRFLKARRKDYSGDEDGADTENDYESNEDDYDYDEHDDTP